jgi:hypothetical protein
MTGAKVLGLVVGFVVAVAIGFFGRPYVTQWQDAHATSPAVAPQTARAEPATPARSTEPTVREKAQPMSAALTERLHPLMNKGTNMTIAADGFHSGLRFAEVSHAAHNTGVPFVLLKDRVLNKHQSLAHAIHELKPNVNATLEANRATAEARSDLAATRGV